MMNIAICDSNKVFSAIFAKEVELCFKNFFKIEYQIQHFTDVYNFQQYLSYNKIDIVFMETIVNNRNTIEWYINNINSPRTQFIFMTDNPYSAYNIYETECCYFFIKSYINKKMLLSALKRAIQNLTEKDSGKIVIKTGSKYQPVDLNKVLYIETYNNNILLHSIDNEILSVYTNLKSFSMRLPKYFLRCHKCYMVNMKHIQYIEPLRFILANGDKIPIPPKRYKFILNQYKFYIEAHYNIIEGSN